MEKFKMGGKMYFSSFTFAYKCFSLPNKVCSHLQKFGVSTKSGICSQGMQTNFVKEKENFVIVNICERTEIYIFL